MTAPALEIDGLTIRFEGRDITRTPAHEVVKRGISQAPEGRKLFPRMSVLENLEMGAFQRAGRESLREDLDRVYALFPRLSERKSQKAGTLSGGEQQMVAIGRALMALDVARRGYVLETGSVALAGPAAEFRKDEGVRKTYLGET